MNIEKHMKIYSLETIIGKQTSNIVPMQIKMISNIKYDDYPHYYGHKIDLISFLGNVVDVQPGVSKRGLFQLIFTFKDIIGNQLFVANLTQYEGNNITDQILKHNNIRTINDLGLVKCVIVSQKDKIKFHEIKHIEKIKDRNIINHHLADCMNYHCKILYQ